MPPTYPYFAEIEVSRLRIDVRNPRIANQPDRQRDAYGRVAEAQSDRFIALCRHIARHGLGPQLFIVTPGDDDAEEESTQFIVLDGNRRLTALKALETPDLLTGRLSENEMRQLKAAKDGYEPLREVNCVVFEDRDAANPWIEMLHAGDMGGAGLLAWTSQQKHRFRARGGTLAYHLQVLDFVQEDGELSLETSKRIDDGNYPVSTLERLLVTPAVRQHLGIDFEDNEVLLMYPKREVLKGLNRVVDAIGSGEVKVGKLMRQDDRLRYVQGFPATHLPDPSTRLSNPVALEEAPSQPGRRSRSGGGARRSNKLIPPDVTLSIQPRRSRQVYAELKSKLNVDQAPNAAGALLRVFLEISLAEYVARNKLQPKTSRPEPTLAEMGTAVFSHMEETRVMSKKELTAAREAVSQNSMARMNAVLHQPDFEVIPGELRSEWGRLQRFFERLWPAGQ